jgi:hypothetical protein
LMTTMAALFALGYGEPEAKPARNTTSRFRRTNLHQHDE